jgi:uncharacterized membrane protein YhaH (DUF805 family)
MLKLIPKVASASFLLALMLASEANAESRLPPCPADNNTPWTSCYGTWTVPNGDKYVGEFKDGKFNGQGTQTWPNGFKYVGEFKDDKRNGQGTHTWPDGRIYAGEFKDGNPNGQGTQTWPNGDKYIGEFRDGELNGQGTYTWPDGIKYVGEFKDGWPTGQGTKTWPNGGKYLGEFKDGKPNGQGTDTWPNGDKYVGEFKDGKFNGPATLYSSDLGKYVGEFKDGPLNGQGSHTFPDGEKYVGEFKDGKPNGQGTYTWPNGEKFVGEWKDNKWNGPGTLYSSNGTVKQFGVWKDDILVGSSAENSSNKAITSALGLPEKTNGYLFLILLAIAAIAAITAIAAFFLMKERTEPSIRVSIPIAAIKTCFNKYAVFNGRASRSEYWFFILGASLVGLATKIIDDTLFAPSEKILKPIWGLIIMLPTLAVAVRRLHDTDRSGWLLLYYHIILWGCVGIFIAILISSPDKDASYEAIGFIVVAALGFAIYFLSLPGTHGPNQYGDDPLVSASQDAGQVNYRAQKNPRAKSDYAR